LDTRWNDNFLPVHSLEPVQEHRAVDLLEDVRTDLQDQVGTDSDDVRVERRVVELAQRQTIGHDRLAQRVPIGQNVGRVKQLRMVQPAHGACLPVRTQHAYAEVCLVQALQRQSQLVTPPRFLVVKDKFSAYQHAGLIDLNGESE
jgi:hypothetical protein